MHDVGKLSIAFFESLGSASTLRALEALRVEYLGRERGKLTNILRSLKDLSVEDRRRVGAEANALRAKIEGALDVRVKELEAASALSVEVDVTRPGVKVQHGHPHPLSLAERDVRRIFRAMNFSVVEGPEVESAYYNFDALNVPPDHPARDMWDTFWLKAAERDNGKLLLRTHTSPGQVRYMESHEPPFQIIIPGRCFRYEATDATHETNFYQFDGLVVGKRVNLANLKYVIETFLDRFFGTKLEFRYRPSYFPFVEPGLEVDVKVKGKWLEMMGAGMVHPNVLKAAGYVPGEWRGFAFGMGIERLAMVRYGIPDVRLFYSGDLRFINQF